MDDHLNKNYTEQVTYKTADKKWMVLRGREHGNVFWTAGGQYRDDWYELLFASDDEKAVSEECFKQYYGR